MKNGTNYESERGNVIQVICPHCNCSNVTNIFDIKELADNPSIQTCVEDLGGCGKSFVLHFKTYVKWCALKVEVVR